MQRRWKVRTEVQGSLSQCGHQGAKPRGASSKPSSPLLLVPWAESDQGRWRLLTIPGPKLPNSDGRISYSDGWVRKRIGRDRRPWILWVFLGRDGRKFASRREPCLWPLALPGIGRRWQRCSGRELTSTTPTSTGWQRSIRLESWLGSLKRLQLFALC